MTRACTYEGSFRSFWIVSERSGVDHSAESDSFHQFCHAVSISRHPVHFETEGVVIGDYLARCLRINMTQDSFAMIRIENQIYQQRASSREKKKELQKWSNLI